MLTTWSCLREGVDAVVRRFPLLLGAWLVILAVNQLVALVTPEAWSWLSFPVSIVLVAPLQAGFHLLALRAVRGEPARFRDLFHGFSRWGTLVVASLLVSLLVTLGVFLLFIPAVVWALMYALVPIVILSGPARGAARTEFGPIEAMRRSRELTDGYRSVLFGISFLLSIPMLVVAAISVIKSLVPEFPLPAWAIELFLLLSGTLFLGPLQATSYMVVYDAVTGLEQPTGDSQIAANPSMRDG